jgi:two-component system chemotaxis response regulator CheB
VKTPIRVMIIDDSALVRTALKEVLEVYDDIEVSAVARDAFHAAQLLREGVPDVILLDIELPRLNGLSFLRQLMKQHPIPTIICSAVAEHGSANAIAALEAGAVDIINKPNLATRGFFDDAAEKLHEAVYAAASARVLAFRSSRSHRPRRPIEVVQRRSQRPRVATSTAPAKPAERVIVIGASTGGTEAIRVFLERCDERSPGIVIVQHMPPGFTASLARRLDQVCQIRVREAADGDPVLVGHALIAPGDRHVMLRCIGKRHHVEISDGEPVNRHRPSVDVLFHSAAEGCGSHVAGVIMTGMGDDGARGLKALRDAGAETLAQDENTCVVYGMPREAVRLGGACQVLPLDELCGAAILALRD